MARFLPREFVVPTILETERFRIRPITINDLVKDYDAVMSSVAHLQASFPLWGWPTEDMSLEFDLMELGWHQKEALLRSSFDYAVMSLDERRLLGCVYIDPAESAAADADVSLWCAPTSCRPVWKQRWRRRCGAGSRTPGRSSACSTPAATSVGMPGQRCRSASET
jgi:hypothetical protein